MFHLCLFGGHGGELSADRKLYLTMFGGCEVLRPTLAKQMLVLRHSGRGRSGPPLHVFITLFGGTDVTAPTLAQEYLDLQNALRAGQLTLEQWDRDIAELGQAFRSASLTLFGGFDDAKLPSEDQELEDLALNRHLGYLSDAAGDLPVSYTHLTLPTIYSV